MEIVLMLLTYLEIKNHKTENPGFRFTDEVEQRYDEIDRIIERISLLYHAVYYQTSPVSGNRPMLARVPSGWPTDWVNSHLALDRKVDEDPSSATRQISHQEQQALFAVRSALDEMTSDHLDITELLRTVSQLSNFVAMMHTFKCARILRVSQQLESSSDGSLVLEGIPESIISTGPTPSF